MCAVFARFDNLVDGTSLGFADSLDVLIAHAPSEVGPVLAAVDEATSAVRELIARGQTYQGNLITRLRASFTGDPAALYRRLTANQPTPYATLLDLGSHVVASASPELFFEWRGDRVLTRPVKGTAARGRSTAEDDLAGDRLRSDPKERAENVIVVDLLRNDLGRVAVIGSVAVPVLCRPERTARYGSSPRTSRQDAVRHDGARPVPRAVPERVGDRCAVALSQTWNPNPFRTCSRTFDVTPRIAFRCRQTSTLAVFWDSIDGEPMFGIHA